MQAPANNVAAVCGSSCVSLGKLLPRVNARAVTHTRSRECPFLRAFCFDQLPFSEETGPALVPAKPLPRLSPFVSRPVSRFPAPLAIFSISLDANLFPRTSFALRSPSGYGLVMSTTGNFRAFCRQL